MRHRKHNKKFGRSKSHREALISMLVVALIKANSIKTTIDKAKVARQLADKMVTKAKTKTLANRRIIASRLRDEEAAKKIIEEIAPTFADRAGGYTRITKIGRRSSDGSEMTVLSWVTEKCVPKAKVAAPAGEAPDTDAVAPAAEPAV